MAFRLPPSRALCSTLRRCSRRIGFGGQSSAPKSSASSTSGRSIRCLPGQGGHPGAGRLQRALALYRPPPFTRSGLERRFLELVEKARLPTPSTGFNELGYELDTYWQAERFAVELDVYETHGSREAFESDRLRQENLKLGDIEMIRVTGPRLDRESAEVIERIAMLLERRRRELRLRVGAGSGLDEASGERAAD